VFRIWVGGGVLAIEEVRKEVGGFWGGRGGHGRRVGSRGGGAEGGGFEWRGWLKDGVVEDGLNEGVFE